MNKQDKSKDNPWADAKIISFYTRAQAIEDGVLVDISELACEAGFKWPVAVTRSVWYILKPSDDLKAEGQSWQGRTWDLLTILRHAIRTTSRPDEVHFAPLFVLEPRGEAMPCDMWAKCGPGDDGEPVITVMLKDED